MFFKKLIASIVEQPNIPQDAKLLDVRSPQECAKCMIDGSYNIPLDMLSPESEVLKMWDRHHPIVVYCVSGKRAVQAKKKLQKMGFEQVINAVSISKVAKATGRKVKEK